MENIQLNEVTRTGAEVLVDSLQKQAVELIFGYPGGAVLPLYDQLYDAAIPNILARHEQGAVHAAEGYAKATGKAGVVLVTSGPGATNVVTGIADAMSDSVPLVVITGQVATAGIGKDAFQEADILGITLPITKHNYQVRHVDDLPRVIAEAFHIATTGRKGPVVIDLPKDVTLQRTAAVIELPIERKSYQPTLFPSILQIEKLMNCLKQAKRPVVLAGAGVCAANAAEELRLFVETHHLPIVTTLLGLGLVPADHPLFLGMGGMHGTYAANMALSEADLIINIGSRFDDRLATAGSQFGQQAIIAHIDIDPAEIGKVVQTTIPIVADAKAALTQLLRYPAEELDCKEWLNRCQKWKKEHPYRYDREETKEIKPQKLIEEVGRLTKGEAVIVTDVGQHQMWVAQYYPFRFPKQLITSGGLGTMGYGIPAGIGAKFACPEKTIVVFVGDGGFQMTNQEFALLNDYGLDVKFILMNNRSLGMVRQWQETFHNERRSASVFAKQPNFGQLAEAYGINSVRIETPDQLTNDLANALLEPGARLIEVLISPTEHVLPMIPPGKANHEMIGV
ncbi:biosynthetic-type acetolactate synthase large subunit [Enterococcus gallinarum]|uniref:biosynthetic-type acetolactate synthase large subunit n=1 Tax=Enterococcus gallinarum TaxID=1353 RepID=UPI0018A9F401|nr:biosynthetic-type acetolactate synthase large subunit [Enterococcus gallinarum]